FRSPVPVRGWTTNRLPRQRLPPIITRNALFLHPWGQVMSIKHLAFFAVLLGTTSALAADWPRFRGPNGQGAVEDAKVPVTWGEKDILYKVAIPGLGNSSPIISKGRLFLQSAREDGSERILLCYDAASAKQLWAASVPGRPGKTHKKNTLASSTPAADGERIYADFWDGDAISWHAFDYQGKVLWHVPLGSFTSQHGAGHSPVVHAGKLFLNNDQDGYAELMAFDAASGEKVWGVERKAFRTCYSSPFVMESGRGGSESVISSAAAPAGAE